MLCFLLRFGNFGQRRLGQQQNARHRHRVFQRDALRAGHRIDGPAAVEEEGTTTIIDAGDALSVEPHGCLIIEVARAA